MRISTIIAAFALAGIGSAPVQAQSSNDPVQCSIERVNDANMSATIFDAMAESIGGSGGNPLEEEEIKSVFVPIIEDCASDHLGDDETLVKIGLAVLASQIIDEGRERLQKRGFDADRLDELFVPAFQQMDITPRSMQTIRPPEELRAPMLQMRDEVVESTGEAERPVTMIFVVYITGLVTREAGSRWHGPSTASEK